AAEPCRVVRLVFALPGGEEKLSVKNESLRIDLPFLTVHLCALHPFTSLSPLSRRLCSPFSPRSLVTPRFHSEQLTSRNGASRLYASSANRGSATNARTPFRIFSFAR